MKLSKRQIQRLRRLKKRPQGDLSYDQFRNALSAPFTVQTLINALRGQEINPATYHFLVGILEKRSENTPVVNGGQNAAAGDREPAETADEAATHRGSR